MRTNRPIYVYVAGPYTKGDVAENVRRAVHAADQLVAEGFVPFVPHLTHFWHLIVPHPWEYWMKQDFAWLVKCDAVLRLSGESKGADLETEMAANCFIPVFHDLAFLIAHFDHQR